MKINSDLLIDSKVNGTFYANDLKCKNLFNINGVRGNSNATSTINGNSITITGTAGYARAVYSPLNNLEARKTYIISFSFSNPYGNSIRVGFYSSNSESIKTSGEFTDLSGRKNFTFTAQDGMNLRFYSNVISAKNTNPVEFYDIQIELGTEETEYTPYKAFENNDIYSSTETRVGTWTDGKPLYRVVYETTTYSDNFSVPTPNIEKLIDIKGILQRSDYTNVWTPIPSRLENEGMKCNFGIITVSDNTSVTLIYGTNWSAAFRRIILILEYTKTTD